MADTVILLNALVAVLAPPWIVYSDWLVRRHFASIGDLKEHANILNRFVLITWSGVHPRLNKDHTISIGIKRIRSRPNYGHAKKHLKSGYPEIWNLWMKTIHLRDDYNKEVSRFCLRLRKTVRKKMTEYYPNVPENKHYNEMARNSLFAETLFNIIYEIIYNSVLSGKHKVDWVVGKRTSGTSDEETIFELAIEERVLLRTTDRRYGELGLWLEFLNSIHDDKLIQNQVKHLIQKFKSIDIKLQEFREDMKGVADSVTVGGKLKGKCDTESWLTKL